MQIPCIQHYGSNWLRMVFFVFQSTMSSLDKNFDSEEKIINEPAPAPTTTNQVAECEMDALLLGRIGVSSVLVQF